MPEHLAVDSSDRKHDRLSTGFQMGRAQSTSVHTTEVTWRAANRALVNQCVWSEFLSLSFASQLPKSGNRDSHKRAEREGGQDQVDNAVPVHFRVCRPKDRDSW
jgi:hypothetical protein